MVDDRLVVTKPLLTDEVVRAVLGLAPSESHQPSAISDRPPSAADHFLLGGGDGVC
jgi:hypothetical protein